MTLSDLTDSDKDAFLKNLYYKKGRMQGRDALWNYTYHTLGNKNISRRYIMQFLMKQKVHQMYSNRKPETDIRPSISNRVAAMLQMDLIDYSNKPDDGYRYILVVVDVFSRKCWLNEIKAKTVKAIIPALNNIIQDIQKKHKINIIYSDGGGEFKITFPVIKHIVSRAATAQQQGIVERCNGTVKKILNKLLYENETTEWVQYLNDIEEIYNSSVNRKTGKTPDELYNSTPTEQADQNQHQKNNIAKSYKNVNTILKVGDYCRIIIEKSLIKKKGLPLYSEEIYTISKVIKGNKDSFTISRYKLIDSNGNLQRNTFQQSKLLIIPKPN